MKSPAIKMIVLDETGLPESMVEKVARLIAGDAPPAECGCLACIMERALADVAGRAGSDQAQDASRPDAPDEAEAPEPDAGGSGSSASTAGNIDPFYVRQIALDHAVRLLGPAGKERHARPVLEVARGFEAYLLGAED